MGCHDERVPTLFFGAHRAALDLVGTLAELAVGVPKRFEAGCLGSHSRPRRTMRRFVPQLLSAELQWNSGGGRLERQPQRRTRM